MNVLEVCILELQDKELNVKKFIWCKISYLLIQWCECYVRCDWSLPMIYQSTDTWMTSRETCFLCFVQHGARFWKCLWDYFGLKQVKSSKKVRQELFTRQKNGETGTKRALDYVRMPKLQEIFTTAADRVSSLWKTVAVLQNVFAIILLWARKDIENLFAETIYN